MKRPRRAVIVLCAAVFAGAALLAGTAAVRAAALGDNRVRLQPSSFRLPQNIGPLRYSGANRYRDRRRGGSYAYNAAGLSLNIYVYDDGLAKLPDGPDSVPVCEQYEGARREIENGGNYVNVTLRREVTRALRPGDPAFLAREAVYEFDRNGIHATSVLWLTAADGYFIKVRLSLRREVADELDEARTQILAAIADALAERPVRAVPPPAADTRIDLDADVEPAQSAAWLAYATELARYSREHPEVRPACGGELAPGFAAELAARRAALHDAGAAGDPYFALLARVAAAGFLDEYAWYFLRDPVRDVTPPAGLDLAAFEAYRQHELADHEVATHARVRVAGTRALPLAGPASDALAADPR